MHYYFLVFSIRKGFIKTVRENAQYFPCLSKSVTVLGLLPDINQNHSRLKESAGMRKVIKGVKFVCLGIVEILLSVLRGLLVAVNKLIRRWRRWRLKRATAYVNRYGFELDLNSRVKVAGKAYYVLSYERFEDIENRREVRLNLIGVPQYREIRRRLGA